METCSGNVFLFLVFFKVTPFCCFFATTTNCVCANFTTIKEHKFHRFVLNIVRNRSSCKHWRSWIYLLFCLSRDDPPVIPTKNPGLHHDLWLHPHSRHGGSRAEDAGEEVEGHRGAAADGEGLHQRPADVCGGDHRAAAEEAGKKKREDQISESRKSSFTCSKYTKKKSTCVYFYDCF